VAEEDGLEPTLVSGRWRVGERWYVSWYQQRLRIWPNHLCLCGFREPQIDRK